MVKNKTQAPQTEENKNAAQFMIQRVYAKDLSFETSDSPNVFKGEWKPELKLDINTDHNALDDDSYESILTVTATVKVKDHTVFVGEVKQAGVFTIKGAEKAQIDHLLGSFCPNILFPYAREAISDMVSKGSFPQLVLAPVNFDALYAKQLEAKNEKEKGTVDN